MNISPAVVNSLQAQYGTADFSNFSVTRAFFYDTVSIATAGGTQPPVALFAVPLGGADPVSSRVKTLEQTNLPKSASLGQKFFALNAIRCAFRFPPKVRQPSTISGGSSVIWSGFNGDASGTGYAGGANRALLDYHSRGVLNFQVLAKNYLQIDMPALRLPLGAGIDVQQYSVFQPGVDYPASGQWVQTNADFGNVWVSDPELVIEPDAQMTWSLSFPDSSTNGLPVLTSTVPVGETISGRGTPALDFIAIMDGYQFEPQQ